jgi:hypothetical protein
MIGTPKTPNTRRNLPKSPGQRAMRPGLDNTSCSSSIHTKQDGNDSDNSDYNYEQHYAKNSQINSMYNNQNSDDEEENLNEINNNYNENEDDDDEFSSNRNQRTRTQQANAVNKSLKDSDSIASANRTAGANGGTNSRRDRKANKKNQEEEQAKAALEAQQNEALKEIENHRKRLQIYVFVCRCIAYPFIAKQPTDMIRRQLKITKQQFQQIKDNFELFMQNKMTSIEADEAFTNAVRSYYEVFLKSDRVQKLVQSGSCSSTDFRDVFKNNIEKRVRSLPEIDGLSKETVLSSWMIKFDTIFRFNEESSNNSNSKNIIANRRHSRTLTNAGSSECILTKEQLYDLFQNILGIKKFEHQLIFNAAQVFFIFLHLFYIFNATLSVNLCYLVGQCGRTSSNNTSRIGQSHETSRKHSKSKYYLF